MSVSLLPLRKRLLRRPVGDRPVDVLVRRKAPCFASIRPRNRLLRPGHAEAMSGHRRVVIHPIGTVHAIALCNRAECIAGLTAKANIPASMRWTPKGMAVDDLKRATDDMRATAIPPFDPIAARSGSALPVDVVVRGRAGEAVLRAAIAMRVALRTSPTE